MQTLQISDATANYGTIKIEAPYTHHSNDRKYTRLTNAGNDFESEHR